jgi:hypothetical protein
LSTSILYAVVKELAEEENLSCGKIGFGSNLLGSGLLDFNTVHLVIYMSALEWA